MDLPLRSMLFIPGDSEKKLAKAAGCGADAIIIDLEDAVAPDRKEAARRMARVFLDEAPADKRACQVWVRVNPLDSGMADEDLDAIAAAAPDGVVLPKANGPDDVRALSDRLTSLEACAGAPFGAIKLLPLVTETAIAPLRLGEYATARIDRLMGLTWGAEDLAAAIGATANRDSAGEWLFTYRMVRSLTLLAAHAAGVQAIDTVYVDFRNEAGLRASCEAARRDGFTGSLAIHPAQVAVINECFTPSAADVAQAQRVLEAFDASPGAGVVSLDGKMVDIPHKKQAEKIMTQAKAFGIGDE